MSKEVWSQSFFSDRFSRGSIDFLVLAIELLMACQAIDLLHPLTSTEPLQAVHDFVRQAIPFVLRLVEHRSRSICVVILEPGIKIDSWLMISRKQHGWSSPMRYDHLSRHPIQWTEWNYLDLGDRSTLHGQILSLAWNIDDVTKCWTISLLLIFSFSHSN